MSLVKMLQLTQYPSCPRASFGTNRIEAEFNDNAALSAQALY